MAPLTQNLEPGGREWAVQWSESNDVSRHIRDGHALEEDGEFTRMNVRYRSAGHSGCEWMVEVPITAFHGGFMDPIIDGLHDKFLGWNDPLRDDVPFGRHYVRQDDRTFGKSFGIAGITGTVAKQVGQTRLAMAVKLPTTSGSGLIDSGRIDIGFGAGYRHAFSQNLHIDAHVGLVMQSDSAAFKGTRRWVDQETLAVSYQLNSRDTWVLQYQSESSALRTGVFTSDAAHRLGALGYVRRLSDRKTLTAFIAEDFDPLVSLDPNKKHIGPDVTLGVSISWRL